MFRVALARPPVETEIKHRYLPLPQHQIDDLTRRRLVLQKLFPLVRIAAVLAPDSLERDHAEFGVIECMAQRHGPVRLFDYRKRRLAHRPHPRGSSRMLGTVALRHMNRICVRRQDDALLPDRAAFRIVKIMDLVENRVVHIAKPRRVFEDEVPENFGGHDEQPGVRIDGDVAGLDADHLVAEPFAEIAVFLVRERLDRSGIDYPLAQRHGNVDGIFGDERLAAAGRRGDDK